MTSLALDRYIARESPLHAADARLKFLVTAGFIVAVSLLPRGSFAAIATAWAAIAVLAGAARLGPLRPARGAFFALPFVLAAAPLVFTRDGDPLGTIDLGPVALTASGEGLIDFATIALKSWVSVQAALLLAFTTPFHDLVEALARLRAPRLMVAIIGFMYRYLDVLSGEAGRMLRARSARSAAGPGRSGGSLRWRARVTGSMAGALFLRAYERSERVHAAMQARGFQGGMVRLRGRSLRPAEWLTLGAALVLLGGFSVSARLWFPAA